MAKKQISERQVEILIEQLVDKMQKANELFLSNIGEKIKKIKNLKPSEAHQLIQILKYGGNYEEIVKKISKVSELNVKQLDKIFKAYSINDSRFAEDFYKYRNIPFVEYNQHTELKRQTEALANIAKQQMYDFTRNNVLGYTIKNQNGKEIFQGLRQVYNSVLDEAFINVGQGKDTFDNAMRRILRDIGDSGLKTINYESGRSVRLDSTIRMHLHNRLNELHNENQKLFGEEFGADGVEISVHENPAPDHTEVQGRQFSYEEFEKLQNGEEAKGHNGKTYSLDHDGKNGYRPISEMNCYHTIFSIILGVSEPEYTDQELKQIIDDNNKKIEFEGKEYTKYEGTQLQRQVEREIRKQKDIQILAKESDNKELLADSQERITILNYKYKDICDTFGLPTKKNRLSVSGYKRIAVNVNKDNLFKNSKVRDENGNLLKMYHGTAYEFTEFDVNKIRKQDYDAPFNGFWFSSDEDTQPAMVNARYTKQVYLNVERPAPYKVWKEVGEKVDKEYYDYLDDLYKRNIEYKGEIPKSFNKLSRSSNDEVRYRLQDMGYDGIHWDGKPKINISELESEGKTTFEAVSGRTRYTFKKMDNNMYGLYDRYGDYIISYDSVEEYLNTIDEEWVVFNPKQIKIIEQDYKKKRLK